MFGFLLVVLLFVFVGNPRAFDCIRSFSDEAARPKSVMIDRLAYPKNFANGIFNLSLLLLFLLLLFLYLLFVPVKSVVGSGHWQVNERKNIRITYDSGRQKNAQSFLNESRLFEGGCGRHDFFRRDATGPRYYVLIFFGEEKKAPLENADIARARRNFPRPSSKGKKVGKNSTRF